MPSPRTSWLPSGTLGLALNPHITSPQQHTRLDQHTDMTCLQFTSYHSYLKSSISSSFGVDLRARKLSGNRREGRKCRVTDRLTRPDSLDACIRLEGGEADSSSALNASVRVHAIERPGISQSAALLVTTLPPYLVALVILTSTPPFFPSHPRMPNERHDPPGCDGSCARASKRTPVVLVSDITWRACGRACGRASTLTNVKMREVRSD